MSLSPLPAHRLGPCHIWTGALSKSGHGISASTQSAAARTVGAHVYADEMIFGPVPPRFEIDHLCWVRNCVNFLHLEAVSRGENNGRSWERRAPSTEPADDPELMAQPSRPGLNAAPPNESAPSDTDSSATNGREPLSRHNAPTPSDALAVR